MARQAAPQSAAAVCATKGMRLAMLQTHEDERQKECHEGRYGEPGSAPRPPRLQTQRLGAVQEGLIELAQGAEAEGAGWCVEQPGAEGGTGMRGESLQGRDAERLGRRGMRPPPCP